MSFKRQPVIVPNGWDCRALPTGEYAVLVPFQHVQTHLGNVALLDASRQPRYLDITLQPNGFKIAGACWPDEGADKDKALEWAGGQWRVDSRVCVGVRPIIYGLDGTLNVSNGFINGRQTSQGYMGLDAQGRFLLADDYLAPRNGHDFNEWMTLPCGLTLGQRGSYGDEIQVWDGTVYRSVVSGMCRMPHYNEGLVDGEPTIAVSTYRLTPDGQQRKDAVCLWATEAELRALPVVKAPPAVVPIAPNVSDKLVVGAFLTDANTPGNLGGAESTSKAVICNLEQVGQVDPDRLLGLFVDWGPGYTLTQRIEQCRPKADELKIPLFIYVDDRDYLSRLPEILAAVGETPWIAFLQCYIDRRTTLVESVDEFARDVWAQARQMPVPWLAAVRCTTGLNTIPVSKVIAAMNALVPIVAMPSCLGWSLWAWKRADGVTGVPDLLPAAKAWLTGSPTLQPEKAREWAAKLFTRVEIPPMSEPIPSAVQATMRLMTGMFPLPQGDPEAVKVYSRRVAEQVKFSHATPDEDWGLKSTKEGWPVSNNITRKRGDKIDTWDWITGGAGLTPSLNIEGAEHFDVSAKPDGTPAQFFISVPAVNHLGDQKPRPGRAPWPAAVKHGVSGFDTAARVQSGDQSYYNEIAPLPLNNFVYATIDNPQTFRINRTFDEGMVQTESLCKQLAVNNRQAMHVMLCGPANRDGVKLTRPQALDMIRQEVAMFLRYPQTVLALCMGNELYQSGFEAGFMLDPKFWEEVEALIPLEFPFAIGQVGDAVVFGPGSFAVMHNDRGKSSLEAMQILADAQARDPYGRVVVAREPARIEAGGSGQSRGDIAFVREELDNAKRLNIPYFLHLAAGRGAYVPAMDDMQHQALALIKAEDGAVVVPPPPPPTDDDLTKLGEESRASAIKIAYATLLEREPDPFGWDFYTEKLKSGWSVAQMEEDIRNSAEYKAKHPG